MTHNADAADPATVVWHRIDNATSPTRFPSGIYVDPADSSHAWVSYSGYNAITPATPGHVFDVHENGVAPKLGRVREPERRAGHRQVPDPVGDGDLPVSDVVRDDASGTLYASTDFGVLRGDNDGTEVARHERHASLRGDAPRDAAVLARRHLCARIAGVQPRPVRGHALAGHLAHDVQVEAT